MSPIRDDERQRLDALRDLVSFLDDHPPQGVVWHYGKLPPFGVVALQVTADNAASQLTVLPVWFRGPHRHDFVLVPIGGPVSFQVFRLHWREESKNNPHAIEHLAYGDPPEVLAAITRWRDTASDEAGEPIPPIEPDDVASLRAIADAAAVPHDLVVDFDPQSPPVALLEEAQQRLIADVDAISGSLLTWNMPRDGKARLELGGTALLASYNSNESLGGKRAWLAVQAPTRRRDDQVLRVSLRPFYSNPYAHNWEAARWLWDRRARQTPDATRWGVADLDTEMLKPENREARIQILRQRCARGATLAERVALCILLQDEGKLEEAFGLFGFTIDDDIVQLLHGLPARGYLGSNRPAWTAFVRHLLRGAAPWLMPAVLDAEVARRATLRSKPKRPPRFRLVALPHQTAVSKASVMLVARNMDGSEPRLVLEGTGWDHRLPEPAWKRSMEIDFRRFGLIDPTETSNDRRL